LTHRFRPSASRVVLSLFEQTNIELRKQDRLRLKRTDGDIRERPFNPKVARSRIARPPRSPSSRVPYGLELLEMIDG
jgi:hypothetical protein